MPFKLVSKLMILNLVSYGIFSLNAFLPSKPGAGLLDTKVPGQLVLGSVVDYKKLCYLWLVEYVQVHQEYEPCNTIYIDGNVGVIALGPQYMYQGGFFFEIVDHT